jgi:hypothetical protein
VGTLICIAINKLRTIPRDWICQSGLLEGLD